MLSDGAEFAQIVKTPSTWKGRLRRGPNARAAGARPLAFKPQLEPIQLSANAPPPERSDPDTAAGEEVRMTDGHYECHAVCIGAFPAQRPCSIGQQGNGRSTPPLLSLRGSIFHANGAKVMDFMENYAFSWQAVLNTKFATAAFIAI